MAETVSKVKSNYLKIPLLLTILILFYTSPLLLNRSKSFTLFPKNMPCYQSNYAGGLNFRNNIMGYRQLPLRFPYWEGGRYLFGNPSDISANPFSLIFLFLNEVKGDNALWVLFYLLGAISTYYLSRYVLGYNIYGAIFSAIVFTMSGHFAYLHNNGFSNARVTLLLPLLVAFILKIKNNKNFIVFAAAVMALISFEGALYLPVIFIFILSLVFMESVNFGNNGLLFDKRYIARFFLVCILALLFSAVKSLSLISTFGLDLRPSIPYHQHVRDYNTARLFYQRLFIPAQFGPGTMYLGYIPPILCTFSILFYFKRRWLKIFTVCLILSIWLSFGPNAPLDLYKIIWYIPVFHELQEVSKYCSLFIILFISLIAAQSFSLIDRIRKKILRNIIGGIIIAIVFINLLYSNIGYFNVYDTELPPVKKNNDHFHIMAFNTHQGDETIREALLYFFMQKNIGLLNPSELSFLNKTNVVPKYFLLPRYGLLMPYTSLLVMPNPSYKGEAYFLDKESKVRIVRFTPNKLVMDVATNGPDTLVINQNYDNSWKSGIARVFDYNGLLAVKFNRPTESRLILTYRPRIFFIGFMISVTSLISSWIYVLRK